MPPATLLGQRIAPPWRRSSVSAPRSGFPHAGDGLVGGAPVDAPFGERVLVGAQLVSPVLALVRPVELVVAHRHRVPVLLDDGGAASGLQLLLQELLLLGDGLELDALAIA